MEIEMETEINKSKMSVYVLYPGVMTTARGGASLGTGGGYPRGGYITIIVSDWLLSFRRSIPRSVGLQELGYFLKGGDGPLILRLPES